MSRIENSKKTRELRRNFIPSRSLNLTRNELKQALIEMLGGVLKNTSVSSLILYIGSPPGFPLKAEVLAHTDFLLPTAPIKERVFCLLNDLFQKPKCENCGGENVSFVDNRIGYRRFCCQACSAQAKSTKVKREFTNLIKYGNEVAFRNTQVKEKQKNTINARYGITNSWHLAKHNSISKISQELFWNIWQNSKQYGEIYFGELSGELRLNLMGRIIKPDYAQIDEDDKRIIEFDGDYWHTDKSKDTDNVREEILRANGWKILRIKEQDYKNDKLAVIDQCIAFLNKDTE
jgi:hypothetical protein